MERYPEIEVTIDFSDVLVDLVAGGYDVALRIAALADSSLRARQLCPVRILPVATPAYLDRVGRPDHPRELEGEKAFVYTNTSAPGMIRLRHDHNGREYVLRQTARLRADNAEAFLPALEAGTGYGFFPEFMIWDGLCSGRLERLLPRWSVPSVALYLVTPASPLRPVRVSAFLDYLVTAFEDPPWSRSGPAPVSRRKKARASTRSS